MASHQLVMRAGPTPGKKFDLLGREGTIGRDINADYVIGIPEVSRRHARLRQEAGGYVIEDLGSTNGTFVNGQRISGPYRLRSGDTIQLGEAVTLVYGGPDADPDATMVSPAGGAASYQGYDPAPPPRSSGVSGHAATVMAHDPITPDYGYQQAPPPAPSYSGQVPAGPSGSFEFGDEYPGDEPKNRTWLWAGLGCLVVLLCVCVAGVIVFDFMNLYCRPPFDSLFSFLYSCP